ncbi:hypothetical protein FOZ63_030796 [Perkinsus olseni]|uniref:Uncharacterized protein n=2 Tax=Perkinsus olseni TaxID=32597 RepID=A0A7J6QYL3_PEROL|nr:hypothetical protein FOZ63_030796 [Perkinsus olseni]
MAAAAAATVDPALIDTYISNAEVLSKCKGVHEGPEVFGKRLRTLCDIALRIGKAPGMPEGQLPEGWKHLAGGECEARLQPSIVLARDAFEDAVARIARYGLCHLDERVRREAVISIARVLDNSKPSVAWLGMRRQQYYKPPLRHPWNGPAELLYVFGLDASPMVRLALRDRVVLPHLQYWQGQQQKAEQQKQAGNDQAAVNGVIDRCSDMLCELAQDPEILAVDAGLSCMQPVCVVFEQMNRIALCPPHPAAGGAATGYRPTSGQDTWNSLSLSSVPAAPDSIRGLLTPEEREAYPKLFRAADTKGRGILGAQEGAQFLSLSKLPRKTLHDIWCLADSDNKGSLTIDEFYRACRLVAHAQNDGATAAGDMMTEELLTVPPIKLPEFEGVQIDTPPPTSARYSNAPEGDVADDVIAEESANGIDLRSPVWRISRKHLEKYTEVFKAVSTSGFVSGADARDLLVRSGLGSEELTQIWDLADVGRDGQLSYPEFLVAMHLVTMARAGYPIPRSRLPNALSAVLRKPPEVLEEEDGAAGTAASNSIMELSASIHSNAPSTEETLTDVANKLSHTASLPNLQPPVPISNGEEGQVPRTAPELNEDASDQGGGARAAEKEASAATLRDTVRLQLRQQQQMRQQLRQAGAKLEALRQDNRDIADKKAKLERSIESSEKAMLLTKQWLDEARKDVDEARRLAGEHATGAADEDGAQGGEEEEDIRKVIEDEKRRLHEAEAKVKELQKNIQDTYRTRRTLEKRNQIWAERQRQAEQDRGLVITALEMQKAKLVAVSAERLKTCEGRYHVAHNATRTSVEEWQRTTGTAPRLPASVLSLSPSTEATPADRSKGIPTETFLSKGCRHGGASLSVSLLSRPLYAPVAAGADLGVPGHQSDRGVEAEIIGHRLLDLGEDGSKVESVEKGPPIRSPSAASERSVSSSSSSSSSALLSPRSVASSHSSRSSSVDSMRSTSSLENGDDGQEGPRKRQKRDTSDATRWEAMKLKGIEKEVMVDKTRLVRYEDLDAGSSSEQLQDIRASGGDFRASLYADVEDDDDYDVLPRAAQQLLVVNHSSMSTTVASAGDPATATPEAFFIENPDGSITAIASNNRRIVEPPPQPRLECYRCHTLLEFAPHATYVQCPRCNSMNSVTAEPAPSGNGAVMGAQTINMICSVCHVSNLAPWGTQYIRCGSCRTISDVSHIYNRSRR